MYATKYSDARKGTLKTEAQLKKEAEKAQKAQEADWNKKWYQPPADMLDRDDVGTYYEKHPYGKIDEANNVQTEAVIG